MKLNNRIIGGLAFFAVCLTAFAGTPAARGEMNTNAAEVITNRAQTNSGDARGDRSGLQNVRDSDRYEWLVHSDPNFRGVRERKECGPAEDAPLHAECRASFGR